MVSCGISTSFPVLFPTERKVAHALLTRPPLEHLKASFLMSPLDLHVLSTPPAFVLSQDQTLSFNPVYPFPVFQPAKLNSFGITVSFCVIFSVSFSRFSAYPAVPRVSQLCYLIKNQEESQHPIFDFSDFFASFSFSRTLLKNHCSFVRIHPIYLHHLALVHSFSIHRMGFLPY